MDRSASTPAVSYLLGAVRRKINEVGALFERDVERSQEALVSHHQHRRDQFVALPRQVLAGFMKVEDDP